MNNKHDLLIQGLNVVIDAQWGSTGKGKLCGWLGHHCKPDIVCSSFGPNAGHTYVDDDGNATVLHYLPASALTCDAGLVCILPDSVIDLPAFMKEVQLLGDRSCTVRVHPRAVILEKDDTAAASETGKHVSGTMRGTGHAIARKLLRLSTVRLAKDVLPASMIDDTSDIIRTSITSGRKVLHETAQGFDLSLNHGFDWPYLTSRDVTIGSALNACGVPVHKAYPVNVIGSFRTFPIRVGNVSGYTSGPCNYDQKELTWSEVTSLSESPVSIEERTTVTKRVRRVFNLSYSQLRRFADHNAPSFMFMNFAQYINWKANGATSKDELPESVINMVEAINSNLQVPVKLIGTGARLSHMVTL